MKSLVYMPQAVKALRRMPINTATRIRDKIEQYVADPASQANNVKRLQGRQGYRLRMGDWRALFNEDGVVVQITDIAPRGGAYD